MDAVYPISTGSAHRGIRKEVIDAMVKQTAQRSYRFKQAVAVVPTSAWNNVFFREKLTPLAGQSGNSFKGIPRGAAFPQASVEWQEVSVRIIKYGAEENIPWEDIIAGDIAVQSRTIIRLTEGVVKAVDDQIWLNLTQGMNTSAPDSTLVIQSFAITGGRCWDVASAAIISDLMKASRLIYTNGNYDVSDLICFVSPRDKESIMKYLVDKGTQFPMISTNIAENGNIGKLAGIKLIESVSVAASMALVVKPKICATYKQLVPLQSTTIEDPYRSIKIRVVEEGAIELTDPKAVCLISNTLWTA